MDRVFYSRAMRRSATLIAGPVTCSILYYLVFIIRPYSPERYPGLAGYLSVTGSFIEIILFFAVLVACILFVRVQKLEDFKRVNPSLPIVVLVVLTVITTGLMAMTFYRVFGRLDIGVIIENYAIYYATSRVGGAWIIWVGYGILFVMLSDMFFGGVNLSNAIGFLVCILLNSVTGGRTFPLLLMLAFLFLLYFQRPRIPVMVATVGICLMIGVSSYLAVSSLRGGGEASPQPSVAEAEAEAEAAGLSRQTDNWKSLNYDAAFILDDVIRGLRDGSLSAEAHAVNNFSLFIPRFINPNKLRSDSETRLVYPDVAERGTTITFPLKANIMLHFGGGATFYLSWLVVAIFQIGLIWAIAKRQTSPSILSLMVFYLGIAYFFIERAGVFNSRLLIHLILLGTAFLCYRVATASWFVGILSAVGLAKRPRFRRFEVDANG